MVGLIRSYLGNSIEVLDYDEEGSEILLRYLLLGSNWKALSLKAVSGLENTKKYIS